MKKIHLTKSLRIVIGLTLLIANVIGIFLIYELHTVAPAIFLFTATTGAGAVTNTPLTFTPAFIYFVAATVPTGLRVTPQGDALTVDLDAAGLTAFGHVRALGAGTTNSYLIPIADGKMTQQGCNISFINSAAQTPDVYGISMGKGANHFMGIQQTILPNSGTFIDKFSFLTMPSLGANDYVSVVWKDGLTENFNREELVAMLTLTQNQNSHYSLDNLTQQIKSVTVYCAIQQVAYILRVRPSLHPEV